MPYVPHTRVTFGGVFGLAAAPAEIWQFGINWPQRVFAGVPAMEGLATNLAGLWDTYVGQYMSGSVRLTRVRVAQIDAANKVIRDEEGMYQQGDWNGDQPGDASGAIVMPLQTALCVSLETNRAGAQGRGRFYLPWGQWSLASDWRLTEAVAQGIADNMSSFLEFATVAVGGASGGVEPFSPVVVSSYGYATDVVRVRVGRVPDTQRRRRGELEEGYKTAVVEPQV